MERRHANVIACCTLVACALVVSRANADAASDQALAAELFDKGNKKRETGKCDKQPLGDVAACNEARDLFKRAYTLNPSALGALRNLAQVEKSLGLVSSASHHFRELARKAPLDPKPERQLWAKFAITEAEALEPRVPHLTLKIAKERPSDLVLKLDDEPLPTAAWGTSLDVDPGEHKIEASGKGIKPFSTTISLAEKDEKSIDVVLEPDGSAPKETPVEPPKESPKEIVKVDSKPPPPPPDVPKPSPPSRVLPAVVAGIGLVGVGVGLGLGAMAMSKRDANCDKAAKTCDADALDSAKSLAGISTIVTGVGGALLVGGVIWFFVTPTESKAEPRAAWIAPYLGPSGAGFVASARF